MGWMTSTPAVVWMSLGFLLLFVCLSPAAGGGFSTPSTTTLPQCWKPEECCVHPFDSEKFHECCYEHGCCPVQCPVIEGGLIVPTKRCRAWECCVHFEGSPGHQECCRSHGCCPDCRRVPWGCCYNGIKYNFRTIVEDLSAVCVQLVCAVKLLPHPPFLVPMIVAVKTCSFNDVNEPCMGCPVFHCVDRHGIVRMEGEVWFATPCIRCQCHEGHITCMLVFPPCKPPPHKGCIEIPGPCCPTYHCVDGCVDEAGIFRPVGTEWPSNDPCKIMVCTETGIETVNIACIIPPPPHEGCELQPVPGECCEVWNCSHCKDTDGTIHPVGAVWQDGPCITKECTISGIVIRDVICPTLGPAPHHTCRAITAGGCCEEWHCDGCWDDGVLHPVGSRWPSDDPCFTNECTEDGVRSLELLCPQFPKPHESCFEYKPDGECCATWNCSGCLDENGTYHPLYDEWQIDPCTTLVCHLNGIIVMEVPCPVLGPAPHHSCREVLPPGACCREWKCNGCVDSEGTFHPVGSEWFSNDFCTAHRCVAPGVMHSQNVTCPPAPHDGCLLEPIDGQCCGEWNCSGCVDDEGNFRELFEQWFSDPCTSHVCTPAGIETSQVMCYPPIKPHYTCVKMVVLPGACCPTWECPFGCVDDQGNFRKLGEEWLADVPCMIHRCESGSVITVPMECPDPPSPNCFQDPSSVECCPPWNCSGCLDDGVYHPLGDMWQVNPCLLKSCHESGVEHIIVDCPPDFPPEPGCERWIDPDQCCPQWNCSHCVDEDGNVHPNGSKWVPEGDPCIQFVCIDGEIESSHIFCDVFPPLPICFPSVQQDQCCPTWNCSGCVDQADVFHPLGDTWIVGCMFHNCTTEGIYKENVECPDSPGPHCTAVPPPLGGCCPTWRCAPDSPDCSAVLCQGPPWNADCVADTRPMQCCPLYACRPPIADPEKPHCVGYCRGPPLNRHCLVHISPYACCPTYSCGSDPVHPTRPECSNVLCPAPPLNANCTVTTPPGECCPEYDCDVVSTTTPGEDGSCIDENGQPRKEGEVWISSDDECRKSQCHKGLVIHHYQC